MTKDQLTILLKLGNELLRHREDNKINILTQKVYDGTKLSPIESFDLGRYYQRMLNIIDDKSHDTLKAVLEMKEEFLRQHVSQ